MKIKETLLFLCFPFLVTAQQRVLNTAGNVSGKEDEPVEQRIGWFSSGIGGSAANVWDFSHLSTDRHEENDSKNRDGWLTGREKETSHHYLFSGDLLLRTGYENEMVSVKYSQPQQLLSFPLDFGKTIQESFKGRGKYGDQLEMTLTGNTITMVDGWGELILPGGDRYKSVFRVHFMIWTLRDTAPLTSDFDINAPVGEKTPDKPAGESTAVWVVENIYRWYAEGSHYPLLETQEVRIEYEKEPVVEQRSAYIYPANRQERLPAGENENLLLSEINRTQLQVKQ